MDMHRSVIQVGIEQGLFDQMADIEEGEETDRHRKEQPQAQAKHVRHPPWHKLDDQDNGLLHLGTMGHPAQVTTRRDDHTHHP